MPGKPRRLFVTAAFALFGLACVMPSQGTPVFVDVRAGDWWSGKGLLTEVSGDNRQCRVSVRDSALIVQDLWVDCERVHRRDVRH